MFEHIIQALPGEKRARFQFVPLDSGVCIMVALGVIVVSLLGGLIAGIWYFFAASDAAGWTLL